MTDEDYMRAAIAEANAAAQRGEVPVGAVLVNPETQTIIARSGNAPIALDDPTAHAEILCLRDGGYKTKNYRLQNLWLFVTLEPCTMCAGAISNARLARVVYGAPDEKGGAVDNGVQFFAQKTCHHKPEVTSGVLADDCSAMLKSFFRARRQKNKQK